MSWQDLQAVFALQFADDIATVSEGEPGSVIRQRLSGVGEAGRALLRDALDAIDAPALYSEGSAKRSMPIVRIVSPRASSNTTSDTGIRPTGASPSTKSSIDTVTRAAPIGGRRYTEYSDSYVSVSSSNRDSKTNSAVGNDIEKIRGTSWNAPFEKMGVRTAMRER
jgi:hypothetical protein